MTPSGFSICRAFIEEGAVVVDADMLEHADRHDAVETLGDVAVVRDLEMHVVVEMLGLRRVRSPRACCSVDSVTPSTSASNVLAR